MAENRPAGNPKKIEKKILDERSSVTRIVTRINVIIDRMIESNIDFVSFIKKRERKKEIKGLVRFVYFLCLVIDIKSGDKSSNEHKTKLIWFTHV